MAAELQEAIDQLPEHARLLATALVRAELQRLAVALLDETALASMNGHAPTAAETPALAPAAPQDATRTNGKAPESPATAAPARRCRHCHETKPADQFASATVCRSCRHSQVAAAKQRRREPRTAPTQEPDRATAAG